MARNKKETIKNVLSASAPFSQRWPLPSGCNVASEIKYSKEQILSSVTFVDHHDMLDALLTDGKEYTVEEVSNIMDGWREKGVK